MSETNGHSPSGTGTAEIPVVRPDDAVVATGATTASAPTARATGSAPVPPVPAEPAQAPAEVPSGAQSSGPVAQPTTPVTVRPTPRLPRRGPLTVMGPWAPVAGERSGCCSA